MEVHGYSVMAQVVCNLKRPKLHNNRTIAFKAIAHLTDTLLKLLQKNDFIYEEDIKQPALDKLEATGWDVILQNVIVCS